MSLSEEESEDLLFCARIGNYDDFDRLSRQVCEREGFEIQKLLQITRDDLSGNGVLHMSAGNGHSDFLRQVCKTLSVPNPQSKIMLSIINAQNFAGNTALHWAALNGHLEPVKILMENGADPTIKNKRGHDVIYEAELNDKNKVVDWVLQEGGEGLEEAIGEVASSGSITHEKDQVLGMQKDSETLADDLERVKLNVFETPS